MKNWTTHVPLSTCVWIKIISLTGTLLSIMQKTEYWSASPGNPVKPTLIRRDASEGIGRRWGRLTFKRPRRQCHFGRQGCKTRLITIRKALRMLSAWSSTRKEPRNSQTPTAKFTGKKISIYMDETLVSDPTVDEVIAGGECYIHGSASEFTPEYCKNQSNIICFRFAALQAYIAQ